MSTDSDIRFTRRKLGDSQRCGCAVIAGFLVTLLLAGVCVYFGCKYFISKLYYFIIYHQYKNECYLTCGVYGCGFIDIYL